MSNWLKNDLGLVHMGEDSLFPLLHHPRHGTLCRRLIKLLLESTLCKQRYPNVYASEEFEEASREFDEKTREVKEMRALIELNLHNLENEERREKFLADKLDYLVGINHLQKNTSEALEVMAGRSNFDLEKVGRLIQNPSYLANSDLENIYSDISNSESSTINSSVEDNYQELVERAQKMHDVYARLMSFIKKKSDELHLNTSDHNSPKLEQVCFLDLAALRMPADEEVVIEADPEERKLVERNELLVAKVSAAKKQVENYVQEYDRRKNQLLERFKNDLSLIEPLLEFVGSDGQ